MPLHHTLNVLSENEIARIIDEAYRVLETLGMRVHYAPLVDLLRHHGARQVDDIITLPRELVKECIGGTPSEFAFTDRSCRQYETLPGHTYLGTMSDAIEILDPDTGEVRSASLADLIEFTKLADALPEVDFVGLQVVPAGEGIYAQLDAMQIMLEYTRKPLFLEPLNPFIARAWVEIEQLYRDAYDGYRGSSLFMVVCPTSPLSLDDHNAEKLLLAAEHAVPAFIAPCSIASLTSPFTLAGTLVQSLAEALFMLAAGHLANPAAPLVLSCASTVMDLRTGSVTYAAPEFSLLMLACTEIGRALGVPSYTSISGPDADHPDAQLGAEMMLGYLTQLSCMPNFTAGFGSMSKTRIASLEKVLIDIELFKMAQRVYQGIHVDDHTLAFDNMLQVRENGNYLTDELTLAGLRSGEQYTPAILNREMKGTGGKDLLHRAADKVREMLRTYIPQTDEKMSRVLADFFAEKQKEASHA